jgi:hypothetical protein
MCYNILMNNAPIETFTPIFDGSEVVGYYSLSELLDGGVRYFSQVFVDEDRRHSGVGSRTYIAVARELDMRGECLVSDPESFSTGALAVWKSLEREGLARSEGCPDIDGLGDVRGITFRAVVSEAVSFGSLH